MLSGTFAIPLAAVLLSGLIGGKALTASPITSPSAVPPLGSTLHVNASDTELFEQGIAALNNHRRAIDIFSQMVAKYPESADGHRGRAWVYLQRKRFDEAIADFTRVMELDPDYVDAYRGRAWALLHSGQYDLAQVDFGVVAARARNPAEGFYGRGLAFYFLGDTAAARANFRASMRYAPARNDALTYTRDGQFIWDFSQGEPRGSDKRRGISPLDADNTTRLDDWHRYRKILKVLDNRARAQPEDADALFALGVGYYRQHDDGRSVRAPTGRGAAQPFDRALEIDPGAIDILMARAMLWGTPSVGRNASGAVADLTRVIELSPDEVEAYYQRALMLALRWDPGDVEQAVGDCMTALSLAPDNPTLPSLCETLETRLSNLEDRQRQQADFDRRYGALGETLGWAVIGMGIMHVACASSQTNEPSSGIADCF
ncbi:MAG: tetratricopeptide repeat protein [Pseudomonadota bacterium]